MPSLKSSESILSCSLRPPLWSISESLAGRVGFIEIQPLSYAESRSLHPLELEDFWVRGGYPEPLLWPEDDRVSWMEQYVKTFVQRDILSLLKTTLSAHQRQQLITMIAHTHGKLWNASQTASAFGVTYHTINRYLELMENFFLIKRLAPYSANVGKRLVKRPKIFFRDTGLLHFLLNIVSVEDLRTSPYRGFSFEGFAIEQLQQKFARESSRSPSFFFYRTAQGDEIDLLVDSAEGLQAYEIKTSTTIRPADVKGFKRSLDQLGLDKGTVVYFGNEDFRLDEQIDVTSLQELLLSS